MGGTATGTNKHIPQPGCYIPIHTPIDSKLRTNRYTSMYSPYNTYRRSTWARGGGVEGEDVEEEDSKKSISIWT